MYTENYISSIHAGYLVHYVSADGDYLYSVGVSEPGSSEPLAGESAAFRFDDYEQGTWKSEVTKHDGSKVEVEVPTLTDPQTGSVFLADGKRKILCVDYAASEYDEQLVPRTEVDGRFLDNEVLIYDTFIKVWDFYEGIGWTGPDNEGTPALLEMDMVDKNGDPLYNAYYVGPISGFQTFAFNRDEADGECFDIMAHEFTHCVSSAMMTSVLHRNDSGAINEGVSDVAGNLFEMIVSDDPEGAWLIGENEGNSKPYRSMKDPHVYHQPEYAWDVYYSPAVDTPTEANDRGGVHINSSLLNLISYKLDQAGMSHEDQFYFWMNVILAMTPSTDYPQLAELLPWCMEQSGYSQYVDAVKKAVEEGRLVDAQMSSTPSEGAGFVKLELPAGMAVDKDDLRFVIAPANDLETDDPIVAWAGAGSNTLLATLPAGDYRMGARLFAGEELIAAFVYTKDGWVVVEDGSFESADDFSVAAGETVELTSTGLETILAP